VFFGVYVFELGPVYVRVSFVCVFVYFFNELGCQ